MATVIDRTVKSFSKKSILIPSEELQVHRLDPAQSIDVGMGYFSASLPLGKGYSTIFTCNCAPDLMNGWNLQSVGNQ